MGLVRTRQRKLEGVRGKHEARAGEGLPACIANGSIRHPAHDDRSRLVWTPRHTPPARRRERVQRGGAALNQHRRPPQGEGRMSVEEIYSRVRLSTWFRRQSLQFHEGLFFAPSTFSRSSRALIRSSKGKIRDILRMTYSDTTTRLSCGNSGSGRCKVGPRLYTDFTPTLHLPCGRG